VPADCRDMALLAARQMDRALDAHRLGAQELLVLLEAADALRRPQRLEELMNAAEAEAYGRRRWAEQPFLPRRAVERARRIVAAVDAAAIAREGGDIAARLRAARLAALR